MSLPTPEELSASVAQGIVDFGKLNDIVHGAADAPDVATDGGPVKPVAKLLATAETAASATEGFRSTAETAASATEGFRDAAGSAATLTEALAAAMGNMLIRTAAQGAPDGSVLSAYVGQWCRVGDAPPYTWYASTQVTPSTVWALSDAPSVAVDNSAVVTALGGTPADSVTLSMTGGANKVPQLDSDANLTTGDYSDPSNSAIFGGVGNVYIPDKQGVRWLKQDGSLSGARIFMWENHDVNGGELILDSPWRMALIPLGPLQFGSNGGRSAACLYMSSGSSTVSDMKVPSRALCFQTSTWTGGANTRNYINVQGVPLDTTGTNSILRFWDEASVEGEDGGGSATTKGNVSGNLIAEIYREGIWSNGTAPTFEPLSDGTITQTCSKYKTIQSATVTLTQHSTLTISGAQAGMRGVIYVTQDAMGGHNLTPVGGSALAISTDPLKTDRVAWEYDGLYYNFFINLGVSRAVIIGDADAASFLSAASITDATQKAAVNTLVESLKSAGLWTRMWGLYPFVGGVSASHAVNLRNPGTNNIAWGNDNVARHNANGVTGDIASNFYGDTGINLNTLSATDSAFGYVYCKTALPTSGDDFFGAFNTSRFGLTISGTTLGAKGPNNAEQTLVRATGGSYQAHLAVNRSASDAAQVYVNGDFSTTTAPSTSAPNAGIRLFGRSDTTTLCTDANLAFAAFGSSLSEAEFTTFRGIIDTFQTALGRANP